MMSPPKAEKSSLAVGEWCKLTIGRKVSPWGHFEHGVTASLERRGRCVLVSLHNRQTHFYLMLLIKLTPLLSLHSIFCIVISSPLEKSAFSPLSCLPPFDRDTSHPLNQAHHARVTINSSAFLTSPIPQVTQNVPSHSLASSSGPLSCPANPSTAVDTPPAHASQLGSPDPNCSSCLCIFWTMRPSYYSQINCSATQAESYCFLS